MMKQESFPQPAAHVEAGASTDELSAPPVKPVETIVIAINESKSSEYAFYWTLEHLVKPGTHKVVLLTIISPPIEAGYYYSAGAMVSTNYIEEIQKKNFSEASALLCRYRRALIKKYGGDKDAVPVELIVGKGDARDEIVDFIDSIKADLLVIGSRGLGALKRAFLGSTGDYCIHHAHTPVLIVKQPQDKK